MFLNIELENFEQGYEWIAGVDEAGAGPLAGPTVAAAVMIPKELWLHPELLAEWNDSKKLSPKKRLKLYDEITAKTIWATGLCTAREIDELNIRNAVYLAMERAVKNLKVEPDLLLVDAWNLKFWPKEQISIVSGDAKVKSIAAASIVAKVTRDKMMEQLHEEYPNYGFAKHKGYPTKAHYQAIFDFGICPEHRKKFLKNLEKHRKAR